MHGLPATWFQTPGGLAARTTICQRHPPCGKSSSRADETTACVAVVATEPAKAAERAVRVKVVVAPVMQPQPFCLGLAGMAC